MKSNFTVRLMNREDIPEVSAIEAASFSMPWSPRGFEDALELDNSLFLVAETDGKIAGYAGNYISFEEGEITNVAVDPKFRQLGVGNLIMEAMKRMSKERGVERLILEVRVSNLPAIKLYEKNGFKNLGTRKNFYDAPKEDALIMECKLDA